MKVAVCLIVRDEDDFLMEWLIHYANLGFDEAIVYDNGSTDRSVQVIGRFSAFFRCRYIHWVPQTHDPQLDAYNDCIARFQKDFDWIAFFDIDEILVSDEEDANIKSLLMKFPHASAIGINWLMFGSNGLEEKGPLLMMEAFTRRAENDFSANCNTKALMRPQHSAALCNNPHWFPVTGPTVTLNNEPLIWCKTQEGVTPPDKIVHGKWRIHHYYTRGIKKWRARLSRGQFGGLVLYDEHFLVLDRNDCEDLTALRFAKQVRETMEAKHLTSSPSPYIC